MNTKSVLNIILFSCLILLSLLFVIISDYPLIRKIRATGAATFTPYQEATHKLFNNVSNFFLFIPKLQKVQEQYDLLIEKENNAPVLQHQLYTLKEENTHLRKLLRYSEQLAYRHVTARVIAKNQWGGFSSFTIAAGASSGVKRGEAVLAFQDDRLAVVGKIFAVTENSAIAISIFDTAMHIAARLEAIRYDGLVSGRREELIMRYVDSKARSQIYYDDLVVTSGINSVIPANIPIGNVRKIRYRPHEEHIELSIAPVISSNYFEYVFVVTQNKEE